MTQRNDIAIGIDLGGTNIKGALVDSGGSFLAQDTCPTDVERGPEGVADSIVELAEGLAEQSGLTLGSLVGLGIGVPGVTSAEGYVAIAPNLKWRNVPFKEILRDRVKFSVEIDNDANVAALGEARGGVGVGCESLFLITLGTGIGGGLIIGGRIHHGSSHSAGEIGHMCLEPDGPECGCGKRGCLEALTAGPAMVRYVAQGIEKGNSCSLSGDDLTPESICTGAGSGDHLCLETVNRTARYLGIAVANIINVISPEVIAFGGGISAAGDLLLGPILESANRETLEGMFDCTKITLATLGNDAGSLGAAMLVLV